MLKRWLRRWLGVVETNSSIAWAGREQRAGATDQDERGFIVDWYNITSGAPWQNTIQVLAEAELAAALNNTANPDFPTNKLSVEQGKVAAWAKIANCRIYWKAAYDELKEREAAEKRAEVLTGPAAGDQWYAQKE